MPLSLFLCCSFCLTSPTDRCILYDLEKAQTIRWEFDAFLSASKKAVKRLALYSKNKCHKGTCCCVGKVAFLLLSCYSSFPSIFFCHLNLKSVAKALLSISIFPSTSLPFPSVSQEYIQAIVPLVCKVMKTNCKSFKSTKCHYWRWVLHVTLWQKKKILCQLLS